MKGVFALSHKVTLTMEASVTSLRPSQQSGVRRAPFIVERKPAAQERKGSCRVAPHQPASSIPAYAPPSACPSVCQLKLKVGPPKSPRLCTSSPLSTSHDLSSLVFTSFHVLKIRTVMCSVTLGLSRGAPPAQGLH